MLMFARSTVAAVILSVVLAVLTALMLADSLHNFKQYQQDLATNMRSNQQSINSQETLRIPACVNEDGSGGPVPCVWDASKSGNGLGDSFWIDSNGGFNYYV